MRPTNDRLRAIASQQHGVFTREQAIEAGLNGRTLRARTANGLYQNPFPGVFAFAGADTWHRRLAAAVLSAPFPAAASHNAAARLWQLAIAGADAPIEIVCRRYRRVHRGFVVHESKDLSTEDIVTISGVPVTTAVRTIVDLGASASLGQVARALDEGLRASLFTLEEIDRYIRRVARPGRTGVGVIRPLVQERLIWSQLSESALEDRFLSLIRRNGLPSPVGQYSLEDGSGRFVGRFDFAYPEVRGLVELDSERWHMDGASFQRDREKQNRAHAMGWVVYRFTWQQISTRPDEIIDTLASVTAGYCRQLRQTR